MAPLQQLDRDYLGYTASTKRALGHSVEHRAVDFTAASSNMEYTYPSPDEMNLRRPYIDDYSTTITSPRNQSAMMTTPAPSQEQRIASQPPRDSMASSMDDLHSRVSSGALPPQYALPDAATIHDTILGGLEFKPQNVRDQHLLPGFAPPPISSDPNSSLQPSGGFVTASGKIYNWRPGRPSPLLGLSQGERDNLAAEIDSKGTIQNPCCGNCALEKLTNPVHVCKKYELPGIIDDRWKKTQLKCAFCTKKDLVCMLGESAEEAKRKKRAREGDLKRRRWQEFGVRPQAPPKPKSQQVSTHTPAVLSAEDRERLAREVEQQGHVADPCCGQCATVRLKNREHVCMIFEAPGYGSGRYGNGRPRCQFCWRNALICILGESAEDCQRKMRGRLDDKKRRPNTSSRRRSELKAESTPKPAQETIAEPPAVERMKNGNYQLHQPQDFTAANQYIDSWLLPDGNITHDPHLAAYLGDEARAVARRVQPFRPIQPRPGNANITERQAWDLLQGAVETLELPEEEAIARGLMEDPKKGKEFGQAPSRWKK